MIPTFWNDYWVPEIFSVIGIIYNTKLVKNPPTGWADLWRPEFKGRIVLPEISHSIGSYIIPIGAVAAGKSPSDEEAGFAMLKKMADLRPIWAKDTDTMMNSMRTEDAMIGILYKSQTYTVKGWGAPVEWVYPKEGGIAYTSGTCIAKGTKNLEAAEQYINVTMDPERAAIRGKDLQLRRHEQGHAVEAAARAAGARRVSAGSARPPDQARPRPDDRQASGVGRALEPRGLGLASRTFRSSRSLGSWSMPEADAEHSLRHLSWRANGDTFDVALAVNRLLAVGARAWWLGERHDDAEAGDYLVDDLARACGCACASGPCAWALARTGSRWRVAARTARSSRSSPASASKYPYFALLRAVPAAPRHRLRAVRRRGARGRRAGRSESADPSRRLRDLGHRRGGGRARCRRQRARFLAAAAPRSARAAARIYLSAGRPGWTGTAQAKPLYTHEYLQSGVGVVDDARLREGRSRSAVRRRWKCRTTTARSTIELGEGIDGRGDVPRRCRCPARLAIDNPLDRERFERDMAGQARDSARRGARGRAVLFSPHPEMGDLVRKYIALDGYVRHYLPIRGFADDARHDAPLPRHAIRPAFAWC